MFQFLTQSLICWMLVAATLFGGVVSSAQAGHGCDVEICCCSPSLDAEQSCCSETSAQLQCQCSVEKELPVTPDNHRPSQEREVSRLAATLVVTYDVCMQHMHSGTASDTPRLSFQPILRQQEILCSWLI
jgi:heme A synthase